MRFLPVILLGALPVATSLLLAQKPASLGAPTGEMGPTDTTSSMIPALSNPTVPTATATSSRDAIILTGRVQMDDGGPTPADVILEKACGERSDPLGYTDREGRFSLSFNRGKMPSYSDASYNNNATVSVGPTDGSAPMRVISRSALAGCQIRAVYPNYHSDAINIGSQRSLESSDIGTIVLHHNGGTPGGGMVSATMLSAPKSALKAYDRAIDALRKGNTEAAAKGFHKAVAEHPRFATAWYQLGLLALPGNPAEAREDFNQALAADPKFLRAYGDLAALAARQQNWAEVKDLTERGLKVDATNAPALYFYSALAYMEQGQLDVAEAKARDAIKIDSDHRFPKSTQLLGYILERKGDLRGAAEQMRAYLGTSPSEPEAHMIQSQIASIEARITK